MVDDLKTYSSELFELEMMHNIKHAFNQNNLINPQKVM